MNELIMWKRGAIKLALVCKKFGKTKEEAKGMIKEIIKESIKKEKMDMHEEEIFWDIFNKNINEVIEMIYE